MLSFNTNQDFSQNYKFLIGSIVPRPIAFVSTLNQDGTNNVAPFSFFTAVSASPMIICFSPMIRVSTGQKKDTLINIEREKEFVINFVSEAIVNKVNQCAQEFPYGTDEMKQVGFTPIPSKQVKCKRVKESLIHFECRLRDILNYGDQAGAGSLVTGEVVQVHVDESIYQDGRINTDLFNPVGRGAGQDWIKTTDRFELSRLTKAQIQ